MIADLDPRYEWHEVTAWDGLVLGHVRGRCVHLYTEPVTAGGQVVASLCLTCDAQLPPGAPR